MDKRLKRLIREIEQKLKKSNKVVPEKELNKLVLHAYGEQRLKNLFLSAKYALENKMFDTAQLLSAFTAEKYPTNADAIANLDALLGLSQPPACVWLIVGKILSNNSDKKLVLTLAKHLNDIGWEQMKENLPDEIINKSGILLSLKLKNYRNKSSEKYNELISFAQQKCAEGAFSATETAELIIYLCESLHLQGRNQEIQNLTNRFFEETHDLASVAPERLQVVKTFKSTSEANLGNPFVAITTQIIPSLVDQPASPANAKLLYNIALLTTK